jgi:thiol-disulfide isomerase/thioredoxin
MRHQAHLLTVLAAAVLALAGCGADPQPDAPAPGGPTGQPTAPSASSPPPGGEPGSAEVPASLDFTATTVDGATFQAAELAGDPVVLWFWAPWCPRCVAAAPDVLALADDVTVVGVGGLAPAGDMQGFIDRTGTDALTHLSDPDGTVWGKFGVTAQETLVVIDTSGEVVHNGIVSPAELRQRLDDLL